MINVVKIMPQFALGFYSNTDMFLGSGGLVQVANEFYAVSAYHVIQNIPQDTISVISEEFGVMVIKWSTLKINTQYDVMAVKITANSLKDMSFPKAIFTNDIDFPGLSMVFRGKVKKPDATFHNTTPCSVDSQLNGNFDLNIPINRFTDFEGNTGAAVLDGCSGSLIIVENHPTDIYVVGVVISVKNDHFVGVTCAGVESLRPLIPNIEFHDFHGGDNVIRSLVRDTKQSITSSLVEERKNSDFGMVENLTKKMDIFLGQHDIDDLDKFVHDLLVWEKLRVEKVKGNKLISDLFEDIQSELSTRTKKYVVKSTADANSLFIKLQDDFLEILNEFLNEYPSWKKYRSTIVAGELSRLLSICDLNFIEE